MDYRSVVRKVLGVLACVLFLCSMVFPFCKFSLGATKIQPDPTPLPPRMGERITFWSFKLRGVFDFGVYNGEKWFFDYWFGDYRGWFGSYVVTLEFQWVLILMFLAQMVTLAFGVASLFVKRKVLALVPAAVSPALLVLMVQTQMALAEQSWVTPPYLLGYWLVYPSFILFIINFLAQYI